MGFRLGTQEQKADKDTVVEYRPIDKLEEPHGGVEPHWEAMPVPSSILMASDSEHIWSKALIGSLPLPLVHTLRKMTPAELNAISKTVDTTTGETYAHGEDALFEAQLTYALSKMTLPPLTEKQFAAQKNRFPECCFEGDEVDYKLMLDVESYVAKERVQAARDLLTSIAIDRMAWKDILNASVITDGERMSSDREEPQSQHQTQWKEAVASIIGRMSDGEKATVRKKSNLNLRSRLETLAGKELKEQSLSALEATGSLATLPQSIKDVFKPHLKAQDDAFWAAVDSHVQMTTVSEAKTAEGGTVTRVPVWVIETADGGVATVDPGTTSVLIRSEGSWNTCMATVGFWQDLDQLPEVE